MSFLQNGRVSPRTSSRGGDGGSKHSASPVHSSPIQKEFSGSHSSTPKAIPNPTTFPTDRPTSQISPTSLSPGVEKRTTAESQPTHIPSQGFMDGGPNSITKIDEIEESA